MVPLVEFKNVTKKFGELVANRAVSLSVQAGTIHGLVGENGAGKSTLVKMLYGMYPPDSGEILLSGRPLSIYSSQHAIEHKIGMVHQHFTLVPTLTGWQNIILGREPKVWPLRADRIVPELEDLKRRFGFDADLNAPAEDLSIGDQQQIEILKVLYQRAEILIFDEPTAVLSPPEVERLFAQLRDLKAQGCTILWITHKLREILELTDFVTVLRQGSVVQHGQTQTLTKASLAESIIGRRLEALPTRNMHPQREIALSIRGLKAKASHGPGIVRFDLDIHKSEIVGIAGVEGSGQAELVAALSGQLAYEGDILLESTSLSTRSIYDWKQDGLCMIPPDRLREAVIASRSVSDNFILGHHRKAPYYVRGIRQNETIWRETHVAMERYDVRPRDPRATFSNLSGGNQQKLVIARELHGTVKWIIAAHPSRGVDLGAMNFIHSMLLHHRAEGASILLVSSELDELLALSDRIAVLFHGKLVALLDPHELDERKLGMRMTGLGEQS